MDLLINTSSKKSPGPAVRINCPNCHATEVPAESYEQLERIALFYLITVFRLRNTFVTCTGCRKQFISQVTVDELRNYNTEDLSELLVGRVPFVSTALAVISLAVCWAPLVGTVMGIIAILANRKTGGWRLTLSWIGTILSLMVIAAIAILIVAESSLR